MSRLYLIGAGGHGKVVADIARATGAEPVFLDDAFPGKIDNGAWEVIGTSDTIPPHAAAFVTIGHNATREAVQRALRSQTLPSLHHPSAVVAPDVLTGAGTVLMAGTILNADALIGDGVIMNTGASIDHDCSIGHFVHISPGARLAGNVTVGPRSWIGIGAVVREGVTIGADCIIGAGSAVISDLPDHSRVGGVPARPI